jgi:DNA modification methylase/ParB-like chromosome segregation protein Spo0J
MIELVKIADLKPHPKNPRLIMRDDVIDGIVAGLQNGFEPRHAIHVRPVADYFEITSGHHRYQAAIKAGLDSVPCWITEMDDDTAYMELVKANNQGELLALEIGIHALEMVGKAQGVKGSGLKSYADEIGKSKDSLGEWVNAAKVYSSLIGTCRQVQDKPRHLYEISKADSEHWQLLTDLLIKCDWSVKDVQSAVQRVKSVQLLGWMTADFKEIATVPATAKRIENAVAEINSSLEKLSTVTLFSNETRDGTETRDGVEYYIHNPVAYKYDQREIFTKNLKSLDDYFDIKSIRAEYQSVVSFCNNHAIQEVKYSRVLTDAEIAEQAKRNKELAELAERERLMPKLTQGDSTVLIKNLLSESVDLICIDPPYNMDKAEWDSYGSGKEFADWCETWLTDCFRVLKPTGSIYVFGINRMLSHIQHRMDSIGFHYRNWITWDTIQGAGGGLWVNRHEDILYFSKTDKTFEDSESVKLERSEENVREYKGVSYEFKSPSNVWRFPCVDNKNADRTDHPTQKPVELIERIIKASCPDDGLVLDLFMGSGTTGVAAIKTKRRCIGFEMNPLYIQIAENRFNNV